jgi:hypothetical protein
MADWESGVGGDDVVGVDGLCTFRVLWLTLYIFSRDNEGFIVIIRGSRAAIFQAIDGSDKHEYPAHIACIA